MIRMENKSSQPALTSTRLTSSFKPDRLRHSLVSQCGSQVFKLLVAIGISAWTARYLGPQKLGTLGYVTALVGILAPLGSLGVNASLSIMLCEEVPLPGLLGSALLVEIFGTLVLAIVLIPFAWFSQDQLVVWLMVSAVIANLFSSAEVFDVELINRRRGTQLARINNLQTLAGAFLSISALLSSSSLLIFGFLPTIQSAIRAWLSAVAVQATKPFQLIKQASWQAIYALLKRGLPLIASSIAVMVYTKSDQLMIEWMRGPEEVGLYSVAVKVSETLFFIPNVFCFTLQPAIAKSLDEASSNMALLRLYRGAWIIGVFASIICIAVFRPLIPVLFGSEFASAQDALVWLGLASLGVSWGMASGTWLKAHGLLNLIFLRSALGASLNVALNFLFIPRLGINGAAAATFLAYIICPLLPMLLYSKETRNNLLFLLAPYKKGGLSR